MLREEKRWLTDVATIRDDTWNVPNMQHITQNLKKWDY